MLRQTAAAPAAVPAAPPASAPPAAASAATAGGSAAAAGVDIEFEVEVVALRGVGGVGAVGELADGDWHAIPNTAGVDAAAALAAGARAGDPTPPPGGAGADPWPLHVLLSNGRLYGADAVLCALGVTPDTAYLPSDYPRGADGGLTVDHTLTSPAHCNVLAAGDAACIIAPPHCDTAASAAGADAGSPRLWFQMRLWNQARIQGMAAARAATGCLDALEADDGGVAFEMFAHVTRCLGFKVVLLGLFNGQGLGPAYEAALQRRVVVRDAVSGRVDGARASESDTRPEGGDLEVQLRVSPGAEYVKVVLWRNRVIGAMLLGDTDLDETLENLILNRLPLGLGGGARSGAVDLLDPTIDLEDYFD